MSSTDLNDSFINVLTPSIQTSNEQEEQEKQKQKQHQDFLLESIIQHPQHSFILNQTSSNLSHPQLDLSCLNSDDSTEASINSLFSFPDPLHSVDQIIQNTPSDQFHSEWLGQCQPSPTEFVSSLSSDHQSVFSSDHPDFKSTSSPSLNETDQPSHHSSSSPSLPFIHFPGSDLSHRLHVYLFGHQLDQSDYNQISFHLRLNFTQVHSLNLDYNSHHRHLTDSYKWNWPAFSSIRFRKAVSRALSNSTFSTNSPTTNPDLLHQTSWLEIVLNDMTCLSDEKQLAFLSVLPLQPTLIILATSSSHCFTSKWFNELSLARPNGIHLFKVLPIKLEERKSIFHSFFQSFLQFIKWTPKPPVHVERPFTNPEFLINELALPNLLLQNSLDSLNHRFLRPTELSLLSTSSVVKLHQLLIPFNPSVMPVERKETKTNSRNYPLAFGCLITILAGLFLSSFQLEGFQSLTQPIMKVIGSTFHSTALEPMNATLDGSSLQISSLLPISLERSNLGTNINPLTDQNPDKDFNLADDTHCLTGNVNSVGHSKVLHSDKSGVQNCIQAESNSIPQSVKEGASYQRVTHDYNNPEYEIHNPSDQMLPSSLIQPSPSSPKPTKSSRNSSPSCSSKNTMKCVLSDYFNKNYSNFFNNYFMLNPHHHLKKERREYLIKKIIINKKTIFDNNRKDFKIWSFHLPKRLKKSLFNLKNYPDLCFKKVLLYKS